MTLCYLMHSARAFARRVGLCRRPTLHEALVELRRLVDDPVWRLTVNGRIGICGNVRDAMYGVHSTFADYGPLYDELANLFERWPWSSGCPTYPVGGHEEYSGNRNRWANPRRVELLDWLIAETDPSA